MNEMMLWIPNALLIALTASAAVTDARSGHIPNLLTVPPLLLAPAAYFFLGGWVALMGSLLGLFLCGLVPYLMFRRGALGGGDVKLFAAMGAIGGASLGLEAQILGLLAAAAYILARLCWSRQILGMLRNVGRLLSNPLLPRRMQKPLEQQTLTHVRLGGSIFAGTLLAVLGQFGLWG